MYQVLIDFGSGAVDYTAYLEGRCPVRRRRAVHNNLKPVISTCKFAFKRSAALVNAFLGASTDPEVTVLMDGGAYFKGTARRTVKVAVGAMAIDALEVECVGPLYRLEGRRCSSSYVWSSYQISNPSNKAASILHQLFYLAGFSDAELNFSAISITVDKFVIDSANTPTYRSLIEGVLRDAVYTVMEGRDGVLSLYDLAPASITPTLTLSSGAGGNIADGYQISRNEMASEAVDVTYWTRELKEDAVVYEDTTGGNSTTPCNIPLGAGEYYPDGAESGESVRAVFQITDREIIDVANAALDWHGNGDVVLQDSTVDGKGMMLRFYSATGGATIDRLRITGDATLKADKCKVEREIIAGTEDREELESEIITSKTDAERVANGRALWHQYGQWRHEFRRVTRDNTWSADTLIPSETLYPAEDLYPWGDVPAPGEYATLSETQILGASQTLRVLEVTDGSDPRAFSMICEGVGEYTASTLSQEITARPKPEEPAPKSFLPKFLGNFTTDPATANEGDTYYNTATLLLMIYSSGAWVQAVASPITTAQTYAPKYLGRYSAAHPASYNAGDWWLVYDTDDTPIQRGVWYSNSGTPTRITTSSSADLQGKMVLALADIAWAEKNSFGTSTDYGFNTFFQAIAAVTAFFGDLFAQNITMGSSGYLKSNNYAESGGFATAGVKIDAATGLVNAYGAKLRNADIAGAIAASSGSIGSFSIGTYLNSGSKSTYDDNVAGVHAGSDGIGLGSKFKVNDKGEVDATQVKANLTGSVNGYVIDDDSTPYYTFSTTGSTAVVIKKPVSCILRYNSNGSGDGGYGKVSIAYDSGNYDLANTGTTTGDSRVAVVLNPGNYTLSSTHLSGETGTAYLYLIGVFGETSTTFTESNPYGTSGTSRSIG